MSATCHSHGRLASFFAEGSDETQLGTVADSLSPPEREEGEKWWQSQAAHGRKRAERGALLRPDPGRQPGRDYRLDLETQIL